MNISLLSVFPELYDQFLKTSIIARAQEKKIINVQVDSFFSFVEPKKRIDAPTFGPGAGMLIRPEVVERAIEDKEKKYGKAFKIFFSPQGQKLDQRLLQKILNQAQDMNHIMTIAARYEGMDARVEEHYADLVISIGDFVLMGGDLPAMVLLEGMVRLIPHVVGKKESIERESFTGPFVDFPEYTEPVVWHCMEVPEMVRSGNHAAIDHWRQEKAAEKTVMQHFDWLRSHHMTNHQKHLAASYIPPHYAALIHNDVLLPNNQIGNTSVTSLDIHDGARSAKTYGLKNYFIVTQLKDQQKVVGMFLDFWQKGGGREYNPQRSKAVDSVRIAHDVTAVIEMIQKNEGKKPLLIATSAREIEHKRMLSYYEQGIVWQEKRPVLFLFGTAQGLSDHILDQCDYILMPLEGFSDFNHLSVRSAMAIVFDRWLGINLKE
jgi:tRNA (guanine37-N1)-methyltransferase